MGMYTSSFLCLGSTLVALAGVLILGWSARRERWRWLGLLLAALFLIGAGFGAAETVYQFVQEREGVPAPAELPVPTLTPTPRPSAADMDLGALASSLVKAERLTLTRLDDPPRYVFNVAVDFPVPPALLTLQAARVACGASVPAPGTARQGE